MGLYKRYYASFSSEIKEAELQSIVGIPLVSFQVNCDYLSRFQINPDFKSLCFINLLHTVTKYVHFKKEH